MNQRSRFATIEQIQKYIERVLPDEAKRALCLSIFADSIERLHERGPDKWSTYCEDSRIRLRGGSVIVLTIQHNEVWLALDQEAIDTSAPIQNKINSAQGLRYDRGRWSHYKQPPTTNIFYSPTAENKRDWLSIRGLHFALLDRVAGEAFRVDSQKKHQSAVCEYIQRVLQRQLPQPVYSSRSKPANHNDLSRFKREENRLMQLGEFDPNDLTDARKRTVANIVRRRGQPGFRRQLLKLYKSQCAISGCTVEEALEAAHIVPYSGEDTNHPANGLLLRSDLHTLFDLGLIAIDTEKMTVLLSSELTGTQYEKYSGVNLRLPEQAAFQPSVKALDEHRKTD